MKFNKICFVAAMAILLFSAVYARAAAGTVTASVDNITFDVIVSGEFDDSLRNWVNVVIAEGKISADTYDGYSKQDKLLKTKYVKQRSFEKNEYTFTCGADYEKGWYTALVNYEGLPEPLEKSFYYYTSEDMDISVREFNRIQTLGPAGAGEMKNFINTNVEGFFSDFENYISLSDSARSSVAGAVNKGYSASDIADIKSLVEKEALTYIICDMLNNEKFTDADGKIKNNSALLKLDGYAETDIYKDENDTFRQAVMKYLKGSGTADFTDNFREQVVLAQVEKVDSSEQITDILTSMSSSMNVNISRYNSCSKKSTVNSQIAGNKYKTIELLMDAVNDAIDNLSNSGGNSGGSGGKSSSVKVGNSNSAGAVVPQAVMFSDVTDTHWAYEAINTLKKNNIIDGYGDNTFAPDNKITRAEFVKISMCAFGLTDSSAVADFSDVSTADWSYRYIASAQKYGIVNGDGNGAFLPNSDISREEAATIIYRIALFKGYAFEAAQSQEEFTDFDDVADYAVNAVSTLKQYNIISGSDGKFNPKNIASRAEIAQMIYNVMKNLLLN